MKMQFSLKALSIFVLVFAILAGIVNIAIKNQIELRKRKIDHLKLQLQIAARESARLEKKLQSKLKNICSVECSDWTKQMGAGSKNSVERADKKQKGQGP